MPAAVTPASHPFRYAYQYDKYENRTATRRAFRVRVPLSQRVWPGVARAPNGDRFARLMLWPRVSLSLPIR